MLGTLLVLLPHVHDCSSGGAIDLVTVHALEFFADLARHATIFPGSVTPILSSTALDGQMVRARDRSVLPHCLLLMLAVRHFELAMQDCIAAVEQG